MNATATGVRSSGSFLQALSMQWRVIAALMLRELHTRYGRDNVGYLWMIGEPMMLATVIGLMHATAGHGGVGDIHPIPFAVVGYITFILFRGIVNRAEGALESNAPLLYHRMVTPLDISLSRAFIEFGGVFLTFVIMMTLLVAVGLANPPARPLYVAAAWAEIFIYSFGHSTLITAISHENRTVARFVHPYTYFMVGLSGAFLQVSWLPHPFREWIQWIPLVSIFELVRYGQFESAKLTYYHGLYVAAACLLLNLTGLVALRLTRNKIHLS